MNRLYMDHHMRSAVAEGLRRRGVDVVTAYEDGFSRAPDDQVLQRATELGRIVVTNDVDFLVIAHEWQTISRTFAGVIHVHQDEMPAGAIIEDLELIAKAGDPEDMRDRVEFLPL